MSFPRYPEYKDSGVEWLGEVPAHWATMPLSRTASTSSSLFIDGDWIESKDLSDDGIRYLTSGNVGEGYYKEQGQGYISEDTFTALRCVEVIPGDILISRLNLPIGRSCLVPDLGARIVTCVDNVIVRPSPEFDPRFLVYLLTSKPHFANMENLARGTTMQRISRTVLGRVRFPFPSFPEQAQIASFLDRETAKIDALVAEQQWLMDLLKEKRQAVISHAVTKGLNPDVPMKPSGIEWLGDVPEHWIVLALKRIADVQTGVAKGKDHGNRNTITVPYLRVANVQDGYLDLETVATMEIPSEDLQRYSLRPGDVLMNEGGDFDKLGRGHVWDGQIDPCITQNHVFAVRPRNVTSAWLNAITGSNFAQFYFMTRSKQSTNLASISSTNLMELPVIMPPESEQKSILAFIADQSARFDTLTTEAQRAIDLLQERRTALISAAVTGQIDVRVASHSP